VWEGYGLVEFAERLATICVTLDMRALMRRGRPIPGIDSGPWWQKKWVVEFIAAFVAASLLVVTAYRTLKDNGDDLVLWLLLGVVAFLTFGIGFLRTAQSYSADAKSSRGAEHDGLLGTLITVHSIASEVINKHRSEDEYADLRVTFHRVAPDPRKPTHLEQIAPYVTDDGIEGEVGRQFSINVGITGQAVRMKEPYSMSSTANSNEEYINTLVEQWSYLRWQAEKLTPNRLSAIAAPVLADMRQKRWPLNGEASVAQMVVGVVYLDSNKSDAFDSPDVQEALFWLFDVVADYVTWRY